MGQFLNRNLADTICAMIAVGFISKEKGKLNIQYEGARSYSDEEEQRKANAKEAEEKRAHDAIAAKLRTVLRTDIVITKAATQDAMPYIIAKTPSVASMNYARQLTSDYWLLLKNISENANALGEGNYPRGAYIGGWSTISSLFITGPSDLYFYEPTYRTADGDVKKAYIGAADSTNKALTAIKDSYESRLKQTGSVKLEKTPLNALITKPYESERLFASHHGMIQVMQRYGTSIGETDFGFEIALGNGTTKVASCLPCSIFMVANRRPPTAMHLGRGDNWNMVKPGIGVHNWETSVKAYYDEGLRLMSGNAKVGDWLKAFRDNSVKLEEIPAIFLEALTFESAFIDKLEAVL